ncbi:PREDICTED: uncharacterized protein LOC108374125 [Rhagoletis zephyria]|uniref:uncharacterized protein LOC108374125 n=1 Tax=Rhagoletis zephyria TaxID=28612 RepID=UPI0008119FC3|nr:PREDICTED: uncharacterized protein LOC108374125 [Rhagoletis zephyria]
MLDIERRIKINLQRKTQIVAPPGNATHQYNKTLALLPTATVLILDGRNSLQPCRVLLDSGAQVTLISEACAQRLELKRSYDKTLIHGGGAGTGSYTKGKVYLLLKATYYEKMATTEALCVDRLTQNLPGHTINNEKLNYFNNLKLADPQYNSTGRIYIILGADIFSECLLQDKIVHPSGSPSAIQTIFGWVIVGNVANQRNLEIVPAHMTVDLGEQLQQFWKVEECNETMNHLTPEEEQAEIHFQQHVQRDSSGRYIARFPFKSTVVNLGDSRQAALKRFHGLEAKFYKNVLLKEEYTEFIQEFFELGHIEVARSCSSSKTYFMRHHAVFKPSSTTTRVRVVFDASCKTDNGTSLNEQLLVGPTIQRDLFTILIQFRRYKIGFIGDIEKMYRQVLIHPDDRSYQRILWRDDESKQIQEYNLRTVTYGTACAPFLATRTLRQVAIDNAELNPDVSNAIETCFYVDDFISCASSVEGATNLKNDLCKILDSAGFHLRKWSSNSPQFIDSIPTQDRESSTETVIDDTQTVKTLGLLWNTTKDCFKFSVTLGAMPHVVTKRTGLSDICKIFDSIGWLAPVVVSMKIFMQRLGLRGVDWDQPLPEDLLTQWLVLRDSMCQITNLQIPRWLQLSDDNHVELHGFADSSELAYSDAIYLWVRRPDGIIYTNLIAAKTRVAPVKQVTLPRLELCAAQLMVKLMVKLQHIFNIENDRMFGWSDSTVVLAWIADHPRRWKSFVANRTSYIINIIPATQWFTA